MVVNFSDDELKAASVSRTPGKSKHVFWPRLVWKCRDDAAETSE